ncbi:DUF4158 domain-containing protein [Streptomyces sp. SID8361]|nr:DUF4158 domain-containing protein [Streptomyces sp. SID8361]
MSLLFRPSARPVASTRTPSARSRRSDHDRSRRQRLYRCSPRPYRYTKFEFDQWFTLARWCCQRAWIGNERPTLLSDLAAKRLMDKKVVLPGVIVLERLVSGTRERAEKRLWATLAAAPTAEQAERLQQLVVVRAGTRLSELDRLCRSPRDISARGVGKALGGYEALRAFGRHAWDLDAIPPRRLRVLVRFAKAARAQAVSDLRGDRHLATLVAFAAVMPRLAADEAIEVFDLVMGDIIRSSGAKMTKQSCAPSRTWTPPRSNCAEPGSPPPPMPVGSVDKRADRRLHRGPAYRPAPARGVRAGPAQVGRPQRPPPRRRRLGGSPHQGLRGTRPRPQARQDPRRVDRRARQGPPGVRRRPGRQPRRTHRTARQPRPHHPHRPGPPGRTRLPGRAGQPHRRPGYTRWRGSVRKRRPAPKNS